MDLEPGVGKVWKGSAMVGGLGRRSAYVMGLRLVSVDKCRRWGKEQDRSGQSFSATLTLYPPFCFQSLRLRDVRFQSIRGPK